MDKRNSNHIQLIIVIVLLFAAFLFRVYWAPGGAVALKKEFSKFPLELAQWKGHAQTMEEDVLAVLSLTDYIMRDYVPAVKEGATSIPMNLYVGYYASQSKGKTYHSPKNCLPGSGWELTDIAYTPVDFDGTSHMINKVVIQKGLQRQLVLYWFQDRGRVIASEYWAKIYLVLDSITKRRTDGTFVRIIAPVRSSVEETLKEELSFAKTIFPHLKAHLPD